MLAHAKSTDRADPGGPELAAGCGKDPTTSERQECDQHIMLRASGKCAKFPSVQDGKPLRRFCGREVTEFRSFLQPVGSETPGVQRANFRRSARGEGSAPGCLVPLERLRSLTDTCLSPLRERCVVPLTLTSARLLNC